MVDGADKTRFEVVLMAFGFATGFFGAGDGSCGAGDGFFAVFFGAGAFVVFVVFVVFEGASTGSVALRFLEELAGAIADAWYDYGERVR